MQDKFKEIEKQVFARRPVLAEIAKQYGNFPLKDYVKQQWEIPQNGPDEEFLSVLQRELEAMYGEVLAKTAVAQLRKKPLVSSIDHHGIWGHPIFVNSALIYSLNFEVRETALALATESVSLNNTSSWSASILYHGGETGLQRHSFLPDSKKTLPVFSAPPISQNDVNRFKKTTHGSLNSLLEILNVNGILDAEKFSAQACHLSLNFWQGAFPSAPKLAYFPLETLILKYLPVVFQDPKNFLSRLVLTAEGNGLWREYFGAEGTFMFWEIEEKGRRQKLKRLPETREELFKLMRERKVYPSSPLCFAVLLKVGLACVGGFTQTTWLTETKDKLVKMLGRLSAADKEGISSVASVPTKNFAESSLAWLNINGKYFTPAAADLYLTGKDYYPKYLKLAEKLTLGQSLALAMPVIYSVVVPKKDQQPLFDAEIFQRTILEDSGVGQLLKDLSI